MRQHGRPLSSAAWRAAAVTFALAPLMLAAHAQSRPLPAPPPQQAPVVIVGPEVQVSQDGDFTHAEMVIAAHPSDANVLVAASVTLGGPEATSNRLTTRTYASSDGGNTWDVSYFEMSRSPDPWLAIGLDGTVYFSAINLPLYRSKQGGRAGTWENAGRVAQADHPMAVVNHAGGAYRNRIYISGGGRTLQAVDPGEPMTIHRPEPFPTPTTMSFNPLVLSDGAVFLPFAQYAQTAPGQYSALTTFVITTDGGRTFSESRTIHQHRYFGYQRKQQLPGSFLTYAVAPQFAVDRLVRKDRIYMVWDEAQSALADWLRDPATHMPPRIYFSSSSDRGATWTPKRLLDTASPAHSAQWLPSIAVNHEGTVGIAWLDTRDDPRQVSARAYFMASQDGGETFTRARAISSQPSYPAGAGNRKINYHSQSYDSVSGVREMRGDGGFRRFFMGGDYLGMAVTANGAFHPVWPDARDGTYQVYTTSIRVADAPPARPRALVAADVTSDVELRLDPTKWDNAESVMTLSIRLHNRSARTIYGPLRVELISTQAADVRSVDGEPFTGAIDYTATLHDWSGLPPSAVSAARIWRVGYVGVQEVPELRVRITGMVETPVQR